MHPQFSGVPDGYYLLWMVGIEQTKMSEIHSGCDDKKYANNPETNGVAIDVPDSITDLELIELEAISSPGAYISTQAPQFEYDVTNRFWYLRQQ